MASVKYYFFFTQSNFYIKTALLGYRTFASFILLDLNNFSHNRHLTNTHKKTGYYVLQKAKACIAINLFFVRFNLDSTAYEMAIR